MCDSCPWKSVLEDIEEMEKDNRYEFANDTLVGIYECCNFTHSSISPASKRRRPSMSREGISPRRARSRTRLGDSRRSSATSSAVMISIML